MSPARMDRVEACMRAVAAFREAFDRHDLPALLALLSRDCVFETDSPGPEGARIAGQEAVRAHLEGLFRDHPGLRMEIEELSGFGHRSVARWRLEWEEPGQGAGRACLRGVDLWLERDGLLVERLSYRKS